VHSLPTSIFTPASRQQKAQLIQPKDKRKVAADEYEDEKSRLKHERSEYKRQREEKMHDARPKKQWGEGK